MKYNFLTTTLNELNVHFKCRGKKCWEGLFDLLTGMCKARGSTPIGSSRETFSQVSCVSDCSTFYSQFKCFFFMKGNFDGMERYHQTLMDWKDLRENASKTESAHDKTPDPWPTGQFIQHFLSQPD